MITKLNSIITKMEPLLKMQRDNQIMVKHCSDYGKTQCMNIHCMFIIRIQFVMKQKQFLEQLKSEVGDKTKDKKFVTSMVYLIHLKKSATCTALQLWGKVPVQIRMQLILFTFSRYANSIFSNLY